MKFLIILFSLILVRFNSLACFNSEPTHIRFVFTLFGNHGSAVNYENQQPNAIPEGWLDRQESPTVDTELTVIKPRAVIAASFPFTLNLAFSGFINDDGSEDIVIKKMCLLYYDKTVGWVIIKEFNNPQFQVASNDISALFGKQVIPGSLGYSPGEYIPVVMYFQTERNSSFNLSKFLSYRKYRGAPNLVAADVIALYVVNNQIAH